MRKIVILVVLVVIMVACSQQGQGTAVTNTQTDNTTPSSDGVEPGIPAPRVESTPTPPLPMTWTPPAMVHGGHLYLLPVSGAEGTRTVHIIQQGDTLAQLATRYHVPIEVLAGLNQISDWDHIEIGTVLVIPVRGN